MGQRKQKTAKNHKPSKQRSARGPASCCAGGPNLRRPRDELPELPEADGVDSGAELQRFRTAQSHEKDEPGASRRQPCT
jgi:hypothetical protein